MRRLPLPALLATLLLAPAALAGERVDRLDDGTVLLKLGPEYENAVIETRRDELGPVLGSGGQPYAGTTLRILTHDEGPHGPISGPIRALAAVWEELSGGRIEIDLVPITDLYATMMLDLERGTRLYDAVVVPAFFYGDLIAGERILPVDGLNASGSFPRWTYDAMPASLRTLYTWGGVGYGVPNDADGQVLYYRRDVLADPAWREAFQAAVGYELPLPPTTWQQVLDIARFFAGKSWDPGDDLPDDGMVLHLKPGEQGHYHFQSLAASFAILPSPTPDRRNAFWFDPADMRPLIDGPGHVAALELLQALHETGPGEQLGWRLPQAWYYFLRGKAVLMFSWGDLGALCQDTRLSRVQGKCGASILPGSTRAWDQLAGQWVETATPEPIGNTTGGSWHGVVLRQSQHPEAVYSFLSLMAIPPVSLWNVEHGWTGVDPGFTYQFLPPAGTARLADYIKAGWNRADVEDYLGAFHANFTAATMLPYLRIRGAPEYWSVLDAELAAALGRRKTAQQALTDTAAAWERITDRLGRAQQLEAYREAIGLAGGAAGSG
jgi:multiple sugar transport system substrate-binding protein